MNTQQIAARLTELCRQGKFEAAQKELFAEDAVSIEPRESPDFPRKLKDCAQSSRRVTNSSRWWKICTE